MRRLYTKMAMIYYRFMAGRSDDDITRLCLSDPMPAIC